MIFKNQKLIQTCSLEDRILGELGSGKGRRKELKQGIQLTTLRLFAPAPIQLAPVVLCCFAGRYHVLLAGHELGQATPLEKARIRPAPAIDDALTPYLTSAEPKCHKKTVGA